MKDETTAMRASRGPRDPSDARQGADELTLPPGVAREVRAHVEREYPQEACGLLLGTWNGTALRIVRAVVCPNVAAPAERSHHFRIDPREVIGAGRTLRAAGAGIVGFFHSHPDAPAEPSLADLDFMRLWPETAWLIIPVAGGKAYEGRAWWLHSPHDTAATELLVRVAPTPGSPP